MRRSSGSNCDRVKCWQREEKVGDWMSLLVTSSSLGHDYALVDLWYCRSVFTSRGQCTIHNAVLAVLHDSPVFFKGDRSVRSLNMRGICWWLISGIISSCNINCFLLCIQEMLPGPGFTIVTCWLVSNKHFSLLSKGKYTVMALNFLCCSPGYV
jgi:hypothetical protein